MPSTSTERSRSTFPASIRGRSRRRSNAARFARIVASPPAPPAMYPKAPGSIAASAAASQSSGPTGHSARPPM